MDLNIKLIKEVKKYECLYNMKCPQYKEIEYKNHLWAEIGKEIGATAAESKKKWKSMRDSFKRNKETLVRTPYKYAEFMKFLENFKTERYCRDFTPSSLDAEENTDISTDYEPEYETSKKQMKLSFENSVHDVREVFEVSSADESTKPDDFYLSTCKKQDVNIHEELSKETNDCKESSLFSNEDLRTRDLSQKIIDEVKKYNCFYDRRSAQYNNFPYKKHLWHQIGRIVGVSGIEASARWACIKDVYRKFRSKAITEEGFVTKYKYADDLKFLDDYFSYKPCTNRVKSVFSITDVSTDLTSEDNGLTNQKSASKASQKQSDNPVNMTSQVFNLLANKITEANLTQQQKNDIEYNVSVLVYSKLAEYNKSKTSSF